MIPVLPVPILQLSDGIEVRVHSRHSFYFNHWNGDWRQWSYLEWDE